MNGLSKDFHQISFYITQAITHTHEIHKTVLTAPNNRSKKYEKKQVPQHLHNPNQLAHLQIMNKAQPKYLQISKANKEEAVHIEMKASQSRVVANLGQTLNINNLINWIHAV